MISQRIISEWAAPVVAVENKNGDIMLCGGLELTVNLATYLEQ